MITTTNLFPCTPPSVAVRYLMELTIELCAGVTISCDYWPDVPDDGRYHAGCVDEVRVYVEGVQVEVEGAMEELLVEQLGNKSSALHKALAEAFKKAAEEE